METLELIFSKVLPVALAVLVPVLLVLVSFAVKKLDVALGIKNTQALDDAVMGVVSQAVAYAEQMAANLAAKQEELHGQEKLNVALNYAFAELQKTGLIEATSEELTRKIEAVLGSRIVDQVVMPPDVIDGEDI